MSIPPDNIPVLIQLPHFRDAQEVVYALKLRGIESTARRAARNPLAKSFNVEVDCAELEAAKQVLPMILDAMLPARADNGHGGCLFCGYSLLGTSSYSPKCPECGRDLLSIESRFAARDTRRPSGE